VYTLQNNVFNYCGIDYVFNAQFPLEGQDFWGNGQMAGVWNFVL
jgi:hypothetical protein